jgi:hypothetical protein
MDPTKTFSYTKPLPTPPPPPKGIVLLLWPPNELLGFERNKIMKQKIKSYLKSKKLQHKRD